MQHDPSKFFYAQGYKDAKGGRKKKRSVAYNYKLSYMNGWLDAKMEKEPVRVYEGPLELK